MIEKYDPDIYHTQSSFLIRFIIKLLCKSLLGNLDVQAGDRVIEIGCGAGNVLEKLSVSENLNGIDLSYNLLKKAKQKDLMSKLCVADAECIPFKSKSYNKILCTEVIEHLLNPERCLFEIKRIADDDSVIVISTTNEPFVNMIKNGLWKFGFNKILFKSSGYAPRKRMDDEWHLHAFDKLSFFTLLDSFFLVETMEFIPSRFFPIQMVARCRIR